MELLAAVGAASHLAVAGPGCLLFPVAAVAATYLTEQPACLLVPAAPLFAVVALSELLVGWPASLLQLVPGAVLVVIAGVGL